MQAGECYRNVEAKRQLRFAQLTKYFFVVVAAPPAWLGAVLWRENIRIVTADLESCAMSLKR
jgi:hypothetical protein